MPKELTHLIISGEALQRVEGKSPAAAAPLQENLDLFMIGSLICDTAYYHIPIFNKKKSILGLSQIIHNDGGDIDRDFVLRLAENRYKCPPAQHFAFLCGVLSHHMADRAFHPLVIYLTGNYHDEDAKTRSSSQARHRYLEGLIDLKLSNSSNIPMRLRKEGKLSFSIDKEILAPLLLSFTLAAMPELEDEVAREMASTLLALPAFQVGLLNLYGKGYFRWPLLALNRLSGFRFSGYAAMLYPPERKTALPLFAGDIDYKDPFTGDKHREALSAIKERAISDLTEAITACHEAGPNISGAIAPYFRQSGEEIGEPGFSDTSGVEKSLNLFLGRRD